MSDVDFNPKVPTNDAAAEAAAEHARDDEKKVAQKSAAFQSAMQRAGTTPGSAPPPTMGAAQQAQKQANLTATAGTSANVPQAAVLQQQAGQAKTAAGGSGGPGVPGASNLRTMSGQAAPSGGAGAPGAGAGTLASTAGGSGGVGASDGGDGAAATIGSALGGGSPYIDQSTIQQQRHAGSEGGRDSQSRDQNNTSNSSNTYKPDIAREKAKDTHASSPSHAEKPTSRIDLASIVPSFPVPTPAAQGPAPVAQARPVFNADMIQQIVEYALVTQNSQGQAEFHMGLTGAALKGIGVHLTACGRRRVRIRFTGLGDSDAISDSAVSSLIESLRGRDVEVADVVME